MSPLERYKALVKSGALKPDKAQDAAIRKLQTLADALARYRPGRSFLFGQRKAPRGLYLWGDVGRGKSLLMDLFFETVRVTNKTRIHFNAFMTDIHARIHAERTNHDDPIPPVARAIATTLICFDEFQVTDVADAMILGRLFRELFALGTVVVATSNTPPGRLYEGGLNRQLFLPFIAMLEENLEAIALNGAVDYRLARMSGLDIYITPLGPEADARMDAAWKRLTDTARGEPQSLTVFGRTLRVPQAARGVARFSFDDLCRQPLAAADYLAIARHYHTLLIDRIPRMDSDLRNEARRFTLLIDTLYDEGVKLICSADAAPDALYASGDGADAFRRTASRLMEMRSEEYLKRGHGVHGAGA
ncbi:MAG TPA: cell division protein ZapE [Rhizomicrobium sp.]|jgi:cell division protein ZapE